MKLPILCAITVFITVTAQKLPKEARNILNVLSLLNIKPESYIKIATNANETQCNRDITNVFTEAAKRELWAMQMVDATAKLPDSIRQGQRIFYGDFEQCLDLKIPHGYQPQYCLLSTNVPAIKVPEEFSLFRYPMYYSGLCLPSTCSPQYIERILQNVQFPNVGKNLNDSLKIAIDEGNCMKPDDTTKFTTLNWITIWFCCTITFFVTASTIYEAMFPTKKLSLYTSFSLLTTGRDIFAPVESPTKALNGFRGYLACVVIIGHMSLAILNGNTKNLMFGKQYPRSVLLASAVNTIDAFLIISGLFAVTGFFREVAEKKSYDPVKAVLNRYLRLMVPPGVLYLLRLGIYEHLHRGPIFNAINRYQTRNCRDSLIPLLLGYDNFKNPRRMEWCFPQFWYISLDIQLFVFTQLLLVISIRRPKILYPTALILFILCDLITLYLSYVHNCGWTVSLTAGPQFFDYVYSYPYTRGVSWFAGMLWAGFIHKHRKTDFSKRKGMQKIMWAITVVCLYYSYEYLRGKSIGRYTQPEPAFYSAFHHITSAFAYGWIIFTLINQLAGPLGVLLSWGPGVFLGNLSYEIYLVHFTVIEFLISIARHNVYYTYNRFYYHVIAVIGYTTIVALVFALFITRPISNLTSLATKNMKILPIPFEVKEQTGTTDHAKKV